jgi:hypothetical protein
MVPMNDSLDRKNHMNELLKKVDAIFIGEDSVDAAHVAAVACAWGIYTSATSSNKRQKILEAMIDIMRTELRKMEENEGSGKLWSQ